jgi:hypothetical protein
MLRRKQIKFVQPLSTVTGTKKWRPRDVADYEFAGITRPQVTW